MTNSMASVFLDTDNRNWSQENVVNNAYQVCEEITRAASTSFIKSFRYLDSLRRRSVFALYAFCRRADDIVDGDWQPDEDLSYLDERAENRAIQIMIDRQCEPSYSTTEFHQRLRALLWFYDNLEAIEKGEKVTHPIFVALQNTIQSYPVCINNLRTLLEGMEDDLFPTEYQTFEDLRSYCFKVASTVGLALIEIYGYSNPNARKHAEEMGIFLQMINVLRDIEEDLDRNTQKQPLRQLAKFNIDEQELNNSAIAETTRWKDFMQHYLHRIKIHRDQAMKLLPLLDEKARKSPEIMCIVYGEILKQIERKRGDVLSSKVKLGFIQKVRFALGAIGR